MPITLGNGTITGLAGGGLPTGIVTGANFQGGAITNIKLGPQLYTQSLLPNGYQYLPNGIIFQWGTYTSSTTTSTITYPIAFPTVCAHLKVIQYISGDTGGISSGPIIGGGNNGAGGFGTTSQTISNTTADTYYWQALGY